MAIRRALHVTAAITLTLQAVTTTIATISACVDRPHAHGGIAAPDCPMHHELASATVSSPTHQQHADAHHDGASGTHMQCRCTSDPLSALTGETGVIPDRLAVRMPGPVRWGRSPFTETTIDVHATPLSPPPR
jgi:hypothetical protein